MLTAGCLPLTSNTAATVFECIIYSVNKTKIIKKEPAFKDILSHKTVVFNTYL